MDQSKGLYRRSVYLPRQARRPVKDLVAGRPALLLLHKVLEQRRLPKPVPNDGVVRLTPAQLAMLVVGMDWRRPDQLIPGTSLAEALAGKRLTLVDVCNKTSRDPPETYCAGITRAEFGFRNQGRLGNELVPMPQIVPDPLSVKQPVAEENTELDVQLPAVSSVTPDIATAKGGRLTSHRPSQGGV